MPLVRGYIIKFYRVRWLIDVLCSDDCYFGEAEILHVFFIGFFHVFLSPGALLSNDKFSLAPALLSQFIHSVVSTYP